MKNVWTFFGWLSYLFYLSLMTHLNNRSEAEGLYEVPCLKYMNNKTQLEDVFCSITLLLWKIKTKVI